MMGHTVKEGLDISYNNHMDHAQRDLRDTGGVPHGDPTLSESMIPPPASVSLSLRQGGWTRTLHRVKEGGDLPEASGLGEPGARDAGWNQASTRVRLATGLNTRPAALEVGFRLSLDRGALSLEGLAEGSPGRGCLSL